MEKLQSKLLSAMKVLTDLNQSLFKEKSLTPLVDFSVIYDCHNHLGDLFAACNYAAGPAPLKQMEIPLEISDSTNCS